MSLDIYTLKEMVTDSSEHVLPNALGGKLETCGLIDKTTNDVLGRTVDAAVLKLVDPFRVMLNTPKGDGGAPPALRNLAGDDGRQYHLGPGAKPSLARPTFEVTNTGNGGRQLHGEFRTIVETRQHVGAWLAKHAPHVDAEEILQSAQSRSDKSPAISVRHELGPEGFRGIAKMACNLFAMHNHAAFLEPEFNELRQFVEQGVTLGRVDSWVQMLEPAHNLAWGADGRSAIDHMVAFDVQGDLVVGVVVLFGQFRFLVHVGKSTQAIVRKSATYRVNPILQIDRHDLDLQECDSVLRCSVARDYSASLHASVTSILEFLKNRVSIFEAEDHAGAIIGRHLTEGDTITEQHINAIAGDLGEAFATYCHVHGVTMKFA